MQYAPNLVAVACSTAGRLLKGVSAALQTMVMKAGTEERHQVLLLSAAHLQDLRVRQDVGLLLGHQEVPGLLAARDKDIVTATIKPAVEGTSRVPPWLAVHAC